MNMKNVRILTMILCIAATAIISGFINVAGGIGLCFFVESEQQTYTMCGISLFISSAFLIAALIIACFKRFWLPLIFNFIGTAFYIYTVAEIYAIPNTLIPKESTEPLAERHLLSVIVTLLLLILTILNFFDEKNVQKRISKQNLKDEKQNRALNEDEKIV